MNTTIQGSEICVISPPPRKKVGEEQCALWSNRRGASLLIGRLLDTFICRSSSCWFGWFSSPARPNLNPSPCHISGHPSRPVSHTCTEVAWGNFGVIGANFQQNELSGTAVHWQGCGTWACLESSQNQATFVPGVIISHCSTKHKIYYCM